MRTATAGLSMVVKTTKNPAVAAEMSLAAQHRPHRLNNLIHIIGDQATRTGIRHTARAERPLRFKNPAPDACGEVMHNIFLTGVPVVPTGSVLELIFRHRKPGSSQA